MTEERKQKILYVLGDFGGGTANHLVQLLDHFDLSQWQPQMLSTRHCTARDIPKIPLEFLPPVPKFYRYPLSQIHQFRQVRRIVKKHSPDIVHAYFFWPIIYCRLLRRLGLIRTLIENREDQGFNWGRHEYLLLRATRNIPDYVICVSEAVRQTVIEKEGVASERLKVIHNGILPCSETKEGVPKLREELGIKEEEQVVGMVANLNRPIKGVSYFLQAIPQILSSCPSTKFIILGRGKLEDELKTQAQSLGISEYVHFLGFKTNVEEYYDVMNISALSSLSEGLSITLLESMNHSVPIVATAVGGNPELVIDGENGFLVPPKDIAAFAEKVIKLLNDKALANQMGEAGRTRILEHFTASQTAESYQQTYRSFL